MKKSARATAIIGGLLMPKKNQKLYQRRARLTAEYLIIYVCLVLLSSGALFSKNWSCPRRFSQCVLIHCSRASASLNSTRAVFVRVSTT